VKSERPYPRGLTGFIVRSVLGTEIRATSLEGRSRLGEWEGSISTALSVLLSGSKFFLAWVSSSISLLADALNNLADVASSLIVALGFRMARKPRDREHPYGHGRLETVATLVLATFLVGVAFEVARSGIERLLDPQPIEASWWVLIIIGFAVLLKTWMAVFASTLARITHSSTLAADAWNHTFDIASSCLVLLALVCARRGWVAVDGVAALGVSVFIGYTGVRYVRVAVDTLIGAAPTHEELHHIRKVASEVSGVYGVHDIIVHRYGDTLLISLHAEVDARLSALEAHALAERIEQAVSDRTSAKVVVHADPVDHDHPLYSKLARGIRDLLAHHPDVVGYHDLRVFGEGPEYSLSLDFVVCTEVHPQDFSETLAGLASELFSRLPEVRNIDLGIETEYASDQEFRRVFDRPLPSS